MQFPKPQDGTPLPSLDMVVVDVRNLAREILGLEAQDDAIDALLCEVGREVLESAGLSKCEKCRVIGQAERISTEIFDFGTDRALLVLLSLGIFLVMCEERNKRTKQLAQAVHN